MILHALCDYYQRRSSDTSRPIASDGYQFEEIPFIIILNVDGTIVEVEDTREKQGKKLVAKRFLVPAAKKRSGKNSPEVANVLWDNAGYVLGLPSEGKPEAHALRQRETFQALTEDIFKVSNDAQVGAVLEFLKKSAPRLSSDLLVRFPILKEAALEGSKITFRIASSSELICQRNDVRTYANAMDINEEKELAICLVSGARSVSSRLHPPIKGIRGGQPSGTNLITFNSPAFCSYGWEQGRNARVGVASTYAYTTALNDLLSRNSKQCRHLGEHLTVVYWAESCSLLEDVFGDLFEEGYYDTESGSENLRSLYNTPYRGHWVDNTPETRFYVLGLSPNVSRLSVRFWLSASSAQIGAQVTSYLNDLRLVHHPEESGRLPLSRLLKAACLKGNIEHLPPRISGEMLPAILSGAQFPRSLVLRCLDRIRAEQGELGYPRVAILKAYLSRTTLGRANNYKETLMALDDDNPSAAYRCGRTFAVLEKIQDSAGSKAKIREKYFSSTSLNPGLIIPRLVRMKNHQSAKLEPGLQNYFEKLLGEIQAGVERYPVALSLEEQALFTLGYYHQRHALYSKKQVENTN